MDPNSTLILPTSQSTAVPGAAATVMASPANPTLPPIPNNPPIEKPAAGGLPPLPPLPPSPPVPDKKPEVEFVPDPVTKPQGKKFSTMFLLIIALSFFVIGAVVGIYLIAPLITTNSKLSNNQNETNTVKETVAPTNSVTPVPTFAGVPFHSSDLGITITVPTGITVVEKDEVYNVDGCVTSDAGLPTYKAIYAYQGSHPILFIGVNGACGANTAQEGMEGATIVYAKTVNDVVYKLYTDANMQNQYLRARVAFSPSSKVRAGIVRSNDAIMEAANGDKFTEEEFNAAVAIIASIVTDN